MGLTEALCVETRLPWRPHTRRVGDVSMLFFGRPIPDGPHTRASHCIIVWNESPGAWCVDVLRYAAAGSGPRALRVPGSMTWENLLEFIISLVAKLGGVSPLYQVSEA